ncbi:MAG: acetylglutamate kinase [Thermoleophilia bacterium]
MTEQHQKRVEILLEALPYIKQFSGKTVVIKYGGAAMKSDELKEGFATDIALLKYVGMNPVIVHGGGPDISAYMEKLSMEVRFVQGVRVTTPEAMEVIKMVLLGKINKEVVALINQHGVPAVGLGGDDGQLIVAEKKKIFDDSGAEIDTGQVGRIVDINTEVLESLGGDFIPVVSAGGAGLDGTSYNVNADEVAAFLAVALEAEKAIFLTDVEGLYEDIDDPGSLISQCTLKDIEAKLAGGSISKGMIPKLSAVTTALAGGVNSAHIIDGRVPHAVLLEVFTRTGIGTKIDA